MSALEFKIEAQYKELDILISKIEVLENKIEELGGDGKDFSSLNKQFEQLNKVIEKKLRVTAETAANANTETQAISAQAMAYRDLDGAINSIIGARINNARQLAIERAALSDVQSQLRSLGKQREYGQNLTEKQIRVKAILIEKEQQHKQVISDLTQLVKADIKMSQSAAGSMDEMSQALGRMRITYRQLTETERKSPFGEKLKKQIDETDKKIKELDADIGNHQRKIGNYGSAWNGLGNSIQQIAREFPSLAYGPKIFFSAISNNLPMLADEIKRARIEYDALKASGQKGVPVWKQVVSSLFSWQTALIAGITLLTLYGDKLVGLLTKQNATNKAHREFIKNIKDGNNEYANAVKELTRMESMFANIDGKYITSKNALEEYNKTLGKSIGEETILAKAKQNVIDKKDAYLDVVLQQARANAYLAQMTNLAAEAESLRMNNVVTFWDKVGGYFVSIRSGSSFRISGMGLPLHKQELTII